MRPAGRIARPPAPARRTRPPDRPGDDPSYKVDAPSEEIRTFDAGDDVHVELMGQAGAPLPLRGRIDGLEQSVSGTTLRVSVALDPESVTRLREHPVAFSLETRNSAVAVSVRRSDTTLSNGVRGVVTDLAEDLSTGWAALLDIPADPVDSGTAGTDMAQARTGPQTQDYVRTP